MLQEVPPKTVTIRSASWITAARMFAGAVTHQAKFNNSSSFVYEPISNEAISVLNQQLSGAPGPRNFVMFDAMGGAISRFLPEETAFVHRNALFMMQYLSYWENDADESKNIEWVEQFRRSMLPFTRGAYRDYCDRLIPDWPSAYFGDNFIKLKKVKRVYDPENFFRFEQSIPL